MLKQTTALAKKKGQTSIPQGSTNGPPLFNLFINDLPLFLTEKFLSNYANDNSLFKMVRDLEFVKAILKYLKTVTEWFYKTYKVLNNKKYHYIHSVHPR